MSLDLKMRRRLLGAVIGASLVGTFSMGTAGAVLVEQTLNSGTNVDTGEIEKCVTVVVPTATATVNATLTVSAPGVNNTTQSSTTVSTGDLGTLRICVAAEAEADLTLNAAATGVVGPGGATVNVGAAVAAEAATDAEVTVNGVPVL